MDTTKIKETLLASSPVVLKERKHDTGVDLLTFGDWIIESLAERDDKGERVAKGRDKATESRHIKSDVDIFRLMDKEGWKEVRERYNTIKAEYISEKRALMRKLDVRKVRQWKSGNLTASFAADASQEAKVEKWRAPSGGSKPKAKKKSTLEKLKEEIEAGKIDPAALAALVDEKPQAEAEAPIAVAS